MKKLFATILMAAAMGNGQAMAQRVEISPVPQNITWKDAKAFDRGASFTLVGGEDADADAVALLKENFTTTGGAVRMVVGEVGDAAVADVAAEVPTQAEGYYLDVTPEQVTIAGRDAAGTYYGVQTFLQMAAASEVMQATVKDYPSIALRGVIEGFYGNAWGNAARRRQFDFYGKNKMNLYVFGPKDDLYHKDRWRDPYPTAEGKELKALAEYAHKNKVKFIWAIHPGFNMRWDDETEKTTLVRKLENVYSLGIRSFSIFFDDINTKRVDKQVEIVLYTYNNFIKKHADIESFSICPTEYNKAYAGWQVTSYLSTLATLPADIDIMWTGNSVVDMIDLGDCTWFKNACKRNPFIWLNYPVTDYCINRMLLGKTYGNGTDIAGHVAAFCSNPMEYAEASKVSLFSIADFAWNPRKYNAEQSWQRAMPHLAPTAPDALMTLCENCVDLGSTAHGLRRDGESLPFRAVSGPFEKSDNPTAEQIAKMRQFFTNLRTSAEQLQQIKAGTTGYELVQEIIAWVKKMEYMGIRGELLMDMRTALANNSPETFIECYKAFSDTLAIEDALRSRNFQGSVKVATPLVGPEFVIPFLSAEKGKMVQAYKSRYKEGWDMFDSQLLEQGNYYIRYQGKYLTNKQGSSNPTFAPEIDITNPQRAEWTITMDGVTGRYKIVNAQDNRYLNEKGNFTVSNQSNPYEAVWHTYEIQRFNGQCYIRNAGSAGRHFWTANDTRISPSDYNGITKVDNFIFEIEPVEGAVKHPTIDPTKKYYIKIGNKYLTAGATFKGAPTLKERRNNGVSARLQLWKFVKEANGRWKLGIWADSNKFINEVCEFGNNNYSDQWNTYILTEQDGKWSIQNADKGGSNYWGEGDNRLERNITNGGKSYIFTIVEESEDQETAIHSVKADGRISGTFDLVGRAQPSHRKLPNGIYVVDGRLQVKN